jgi:CMP-N-acetylneuraminic acid synthetase
MIVAFVPARGGSKRLPRKNVRTFAGKPLLYYAIALAHSIRSVERCVVSTDDAEIAEVARQYDAQVIVRPPELATDESRTADAAQHTLKVLRDTGVMPAALLTLQPNCPLRPRWLVERALEVFELNGVDSVVSVTPAAPKLGSIRNGRFVPAYPPGIRSQDLPPAFFENGLVYVSRADIVLAEADLFGSRIVPLITDPLYARGDIDTELDFQIAEFLFQKYSHEFQCS